MGEILKDKQGTPYYVLMRDRYLPVPICTILTPIAAVILINNFKLKLML